MRKVLASNKHRNIETNRNHNCLQYVSWQCFHFVPNCIRPHNIYAMFKVFSGIFQAFDTSPILTCFNLVHFVSVEDISVCRQAMDNRDSAPLI